MTPFFMLESFLDYLRNEKRASEHTVLAYQTDLNQFFNQFEISDHSQLDNMMVRKLGC